MSYMKHKKYNGFKKVKIRYYKKYDKRCVICKKAWNTELHHLTYKDSGGKEKDSQLIQLCTKHHLLLHQAFIYSDLSLYHFTYKFLRMNIENFTTLENARMPLHVPKKEPEKKKEVIVIPRKPKKVKKREHKKNSIESKARQKEMKQKAQDKMYKKLGFRTPSEIWESYIASK